MRFLRSASVFATLLALACSLAWAAEKKGGDYKNVGPEQFDKLRVSKDAVILDVRRASEFKDGRIAGATNVDWYGSDFERRLAAMDKSKTYLVHCAGGVRSSKAAEKMAALNFTNVFNLEGGFKAWEKAGKPVER